MLDTQELKRVAKQHGADLVGVGAMSRFAGAPKQSDPRYIMPKAQTIIGLGFRIHRGLLRGIEEGTYYAGYPAMGYANINDVFAPMVLRRVGSFIEDMGYEAVLYQNTSVRLGTDAGVQADPQLPNPDVFLHFRIAGTICGLGNIGHSKVFLTPEFGPRQRLAFIITDAPFAPDPILEEPICDGCMQCAVECPAQAISRDRTVEVEVEGKRFRWGELDTRKCGVVFNTGDPETSPFLPDEVRREVRAYLDALDADPDNPNVRQDMNAYLTENVPYINRTWYSYHHPAALCGAQGCIRACMKHLESQRRVGNQFANAFRKQGGTN